MRTAHRSEVIGARSAMELVTTAATDGGEIKFGFHRWLLESSKVGTDRLPP